MKRTTWGVFTLAGLLAAAALAAAPQQGDGKATADPRLDKVIEQNDQILKNQQEILKSLGELRQEVLQIRRRSS